VSLDAGQAFQQEVSRVQGLIAALDALRDPAAREPARELVQVVLALHGVGLARLLELIAATKSGPALIAKLAEDDKVNGLLLLHGLHPRNLETRVRQAVEKLRPHLGVVGAKIEAVDFTGETVHLRVRPGANTTQAAAQTLKLSIEDAIYEAAPDITDIRIDGLDGTIAFVSVSSIKRPSIKRENIKAQGIIQPIDAADHGP